ncbi:hypothetical protein Golob_023310, partial [Gossypium lobatum]|nr:hypothetical protein [Gossypium lobatum]
MKEVHAISICYCGFSAPLRTLWSNSNPGRRLFRCRNYSGRRRFCFFTWFDNPTSPRARGLDLVLGVEFRMIIGLGFDDFVKDC